MCFFLVSYIMLSIVHQAFMAHMMMILKKENKRPIGAIQKLKLSKAMQLGAVYFVIYMAKNIK